MVHWSARFVAMLVRGLPPVSENMTYSISGSLIVSLTNSNSKIAFNPLPEDDPKVRQPDIRKAREILDWEPNVERVVGLEKTIDFFKSKLKSASNF